jgi:hypothetical protein
MSTKVRDILGVIYADLAQVLRLITPQAFALSRYERSTPLLHLSAAEMVANPALAHEALETQGSTALEDAMRAVGERYISGADRLRELRERATGEGTKASLGASCSREER